MKLHEAIKTIVDTFGKDVITERRFLNMVADYYSFKDNPPGKRVLSALVNGGYLSRLVGTLSEKELTIAISQIKNDVENNYGFRQDLIEDILASIVQGLNLKRAEPSSKKFANQTQTVNKNNTKLIKYHLKNAFGYYNVKNDTFLILKGSRLDFQEFREGWLSKEEIKRKRIIESHCDTVKPHFIVKSDILCSSPNEAAFIVTGTNMIGKIAWVDDNGKSLYQNDNRITENFEKLVNDSVNNETQKKEPFVKFADSTSAPNRKETTGGDGPSAKNYHTANVNKNATRKPTKANATATKKDLPYVKIAAFWTVIIFGVFFGYNFFDSSEERENFQQSLFSGDTFLNSGDYANAVESYKAAYSGYNSFNKSSYKSDALEKIDALTDQLIKEGDSKSLNQAYTTIVSELQLDLNNVDKERLESKKTELEATIQERIDNGRNTLITNISANNGKLDDNGKKLLGELLELSPNDYWLNFIKEKSYE